MAAKHTTVTYNNKTTTDEECCVHRRCIIETTTIITVTHVDTEIPIRRCVRHGYLYHKKKVIYW